jgi:hypothetical protein
MATLSPLANALFVTEGVTSAGAGACLAPGIKSADFFRSK